MSSRGKERGRKKSQADSVLTLEPQHGTQSYDPEITTRAETKSQLPNLLTQLGPPQDFVLGKNYFFNVLHYVKYDKCNQGVNKKM